MAKRRMFNLNIVDDDVFLAMPISAQSLYFHLGMRADDDGFVTPLKVMRMVGANQDDLRILIAKRYVLAFDSGVVVIKHWPVQNKVQKDRYVQTTYQKEFNQLTLNEWGVYTEKRNSQTSLMDVISDTTSNRGELPRTVENVSKMETQSSVVQSSLDTVVSDSETVEKKTKATTGLNKSAGKSFTEITLLFEDLESQGLVNNRFKAWYCSAFYKLGRERVQILASQAKADGKDPQKLFNHLIQTESGMKQKAKV